MQDTSQKQYTDSFEPERVFLPGSKWILILGIFSIIGCWLYGIVGLISGFFSLSLSKKALSIHRRQESRYEEKALKNIKAGRVFAMIGVSLSVLYLIMLFIEIIA
jgi:hypothetical protein